MVAPNPRRSNFLVAKRGGSSAPSVPRDGSAPPPRRPYPTGRVTVASTRVPSEGSLLAGIPIRDQTLPAGKSQPATAGPSNPPAGATVVPPFEMASKSVPVESSRKKRKSRRDGDKSSKRNRREGNEPVAPIPGGVFSTEYNVGQRVDFTWDRPIKLFWIQCPVRH